jgi:predicted RNA-binding protein with PIN domain
MAREFLLIDAHNVIFARPDLAALHRRQPAAAREQLIRLLERHQDAAGVRVVVVFDGGTQARGTSEPSGPAGIQVFYPRAGQSADAIIERLVLKYAATHRLTVATNDSLIRTAAVAAGASTIGAETLFDDLQRADKELDQALEKLRRRK